MRANQAEWEVARIKGRARWLARLRDWLLDNQDPIADTTVEMIEAVGWECFEERFFRVLLRPAPGPAGAECCSQAIVIDDEALRGRVVAPQLRQTPRSSPAAAFPRAGDPTS